MKKKKVLAVDLLRPRELKGGRGEGVKLIPETSWRSHRLKYCFCGSFTR